MRPALCEVDPSISVLILKVSCPCQQLHGTCGLHHQQKLQEDLLGFAHIVDVEIHVGPYCGGSWGAQGLRKQKAPEATKFARNANQGPKGLGPEEQRTQG